MQKEVGPKGSIFVIRLESIQQGHKLEGSPFDSKVFLPTFYVRKFGKSFSSKMPDRLTARTQEMICHYLADHVPCCNDEKEEEVVETIEQMYARADITEQAMCSMISGKPGLYGRKTGEGILILSCFIGKRPCIEVVASTISNISPSNAFLPVHLLTHKVLEQVTDDNTYARQLALYMFLRNELAELLIQPKPSGKKEEKKAAIKQAAKTAQASEQAAEQVAIANMRKSAVSLSEAATGRMGYVVMTHASGEMIVLFGQVGADKVVQVVHLSAKHMLKIAGVDIGDKVYLGQLLHGKIDRIDAMNHRMSPEQIKTCDALIKHIRDHLKDARITLRSPRTNLRLVKKVA